MAFRNYFEGRPKGTQMVLYALSLIGIIVILSTTLSITFQWVRLLHNAIFGHNKIDWDSLCVQPVALQPDTRFANASMFLDGGYKAHSAELLKGAIQIPTESYDDMTQDPNEDSRFEVFDTFHTYLHKKFPLISSSLEKINTYGLLYTVEGTNPSLAPVVLMAHQDVVPVERTTINQWKHGAFSGHYDGQYIWGRGSLDTKNSLIAILEATEALLSQKWNPERTTLISFGFDEELDGSRGALHLANVIRDRYGESDSVYMIIDEGGGVETQEATNFAYAMVSEKGYTDIDVIVHTPGGHSSIPPDHTGIGVLSEVLTRLEDSHAANNKYILKPDDVVFSQFTCLAKYGQELSESKRSNLIDVDYLQRKLSTDQSMRSLIGTTQGIDVIKGGSKINALPEQANAIVNYRIDVHDSVEIVTNRTLKIAEEVGKLYGLNVSANGQLTSASADNQAGLIEIVNGQSIEPSPVSPFNSDNEQWKLLVGTSLHALQEWFGLDKIVVAPALSVGNTDTWRYKGLTKHVYRYTVGLPNAGENAHTVNERISLDSHLATVVWYYELLQFF